MADVDALLYLPGHDPEQMKAALAAGSAPARASRFVVYPQAGHAFNADYRASYRKDAADDAWGQMQAWFKKYGVLS